MSSVHTQRSSTPWLTLGLAASAGVLSFLTPWSAVAQVVLLAFAIYRLTRRPPRSEAIALVIAIVILSVALLAVATVGLVLLQLETTQGGTSVPLP